MSFPNFFDNFPIFHKNISIFIRLHAKQPLFDLEFLIVGQMKKPRTEIEHKIRLMGGKIASEINSKIAAVISNIEEVNQAQGNIKEAFLRRIQVVPEEFVDEAMNTDDVIKLIADRDMSQWGRDVCLEHTNFIEIRGFYEITFDF